MLYIMCEVCILSNWFYENRWTVLGLTLKYVCPMHLCHRPFPVKVAFIKYTIWIASMWNNYVVCVFFNIKFRINGVHPNIINNNLHLFSYWYEKWQEKSERDIIIITLMGMRRFVLTQSRMLDALIYLPVCLYF